MDELLSRINELARKQKQGVLSAEEQVEQELLRKRYAAQFRASLQAQLDGIVFERPDGSLETLRRKKGEDA